MSEINYTKICFNKSKNIESNAALVYTIFHGEDIIYKTFIKDDNKIELRYEYYQNEK